MSRRGSGDSNRIAGLALLQSGEFPRKLLKIAMPKTFKASKFKASDTAGKQFTIGGTVAFTAAKTEGDKKSLPRFDILANTGIPMPLKGFAYPVIVDMRGAYFVAKKTPVIMDHDDTKRIGHSETQIIDMKASTIHVEGPVSSTSESARQFVEDSGNDFPFQASLGGGVGSPEFVPSGKSVTVNGKSWNGPVIVSRKTPISEVTVTLFGADPKTTSTLKVAAKRGHIMDFAEFCASIGVDHDTLEGENLTNVQELHAMKFPTPDPTKRPRGPARKEPETTQILTAQQHVEETNKLQAANALRINGIETMCLKYGEQINDRNIQAMDASDKEMVGTDGKAVMMKLSEFKAHAIGNNLTANQVELVLLRSGRTDIPHVPGIAIKDGDIDSKALEASICRHFGMKNRDQNKNKITGEVMGRAYGYEEYYKDEVLQASEESKYNFGGSIQNLLAMQIEAGGGYASRRMGEDELIQESFKAFNKVSTSPFRASGFSTLNIPNVLENVMHKFALASFDSVESVWPKICGRRSANDFRPQNLYRLDFSGHFRKVAPDGELKHITMVDTKRTITPDTYGAMLTIDRKTIRNDDMQMIISKASGIGALGALRIEESVFVILLGNGGAFFSAANSNLITGAGSVLGLTGLEAARQSFLNQVINGKPIGLSPSILLVGTTNVTLSRQLWKDENVMIAGTAGAVTTAFTKNQFQGSYYPYASPYLNNTAVKDQDGNAISGQSSTQWFMFCDAAAPQGAAVMIAFMDGRDTPFFDTAQTEFSIPGGISFRAYLDWGVAYGIQELALKSAGA